MAILKHRRRDAPRIRGQRFRLFGAGIADRHIEIDFIVFIGKLRLFRLGNLRQPLIRINITAFFLRTSNRRAGNQRSPNAGNAVRNDDLFQRRIGREHVRAQRFHRIGNFHFAQRRAFAESAVVYRNQVAFVRSVGSVKINRRQRRAFAERLHADVHKIFSRRQFRRLGISVKRVLRHRNHRIGQRDFLHRAAVRKRRSADRLHVFTDFYAFQRIAIPERAFFDRRDAVGNVHRRQSVAVLKRSAAEGSKRVVQRRRFQIRAVVKGFFAHRTHIRAKHHARYSRTAAECAVRNARYRLASVFVLKRNRARRGSAHLRDFIFRIIVDQRVYATRGVIHVEFQPRRPCGLHGILFARICAYAQHVIARL